MTLRVYTGGATVELVDEAPAPVPPIPGTGVLATLQSGFARLYGSYANPDPAWFPKGTQMLADCGGVMDVARKQFLLMGGASHGIAQGTEIRAFSTDTGTWRNVYESTPWADMLAANLQTNPGKWISTGHPPAAHTHGCLVVRGNSLYRMQNYCQTDSLPAGNLPYFTGHICWYDFVTGAWNFSQTVQMWNLGASAVLDPVSQNIYIFGQDSGFFTTIFKFDPVADTLVQAPNTARYGNNGQPTDAAYCPLDDKFYAFQNGGVVSRCTINRANFNASVSSVLTTTGPKPVLARPKGYPSFTWDSTRNRFGGCFVDGVHFEFDPVSLAWSTTTMQIEAGSGTSWPSNDFSCSSFDSTSGCYIFAEYAGTVAGRSWAYRP